MSVKRQGTRHTAIYDAAELLVRGYLQRRNILTAEPPRQYQAFDLLAVHPEPVKTGRRTIKIQVKSRLAIDAHTFKTLNGK